MNKNIKYFQNFWSKQTTGLTSVYRNYQEEMKELLFFLDQDKKYDCLELGCGNGELYEFTKSLYNYYTGVDFSVSNLQIFKNNHPNVNLICSDVLNIPDNNKYNLIHSNGLIQYLTLNQIEKLLKSNINNLAENGIIIHRGIPDKQLQFLYFSGYLKPGDEYLHFNKIFHSIIYRIYASFNRMLKGGDIFGYWYKVNDIRHICEKINTNYNIYGSILYRYRYSLVIKYNYRID